VATSNNLLDFFYFNGTIRPPIVLTTNGSYSLIKYPNPIQLPLTTLPYSRKGSPNATNTPGSGKPPEINLIVPIAVLAIVFTALVGRKIHKPSKEIDSAGRAA
jgi:hypothetical protein